MMNNLITTTFTNYNLIKMNKFTNNFGTHLYLILLTLSTVRYYDIKKQLTNMACCDPCRSSGCRHIWR